VWILDTDTLSLWSGGHPIVTKRILFAHPSDIRTTIVTVEEVLGGWYALVRKARRDDETARAYGGLLGAMESLRNIKILGIETSTLAKFWTLRRALRRMGTSDLRIAAICLENDATLVTRNLRDFQQVPGLRIEDWSR
jgi:tRNA(fMet)-specific endonuclease VapC